MKLNVWKVRKPGFFDSFDLVSEEEQGSRTRGQYLGTIEVTEPGKEIKAMNFDATRFSRDDKTDTVEFVIPKEATTARASFDLPAPQKTVTKEAYPMRMDIVNIESDSSLVVPFHIPGDAKNIKCTYEVEE